VKELENPNAQGPNDLEQGAQPRVIYPERQSFEFPGMQLDFPERPQPEPTETPSYPIPTPAQRQEIPSSGVRFMGGLIDSLIPSASADDDLVYERAEEIAKSKGVNLDSVQSPEVSFKISERDSLGDEEVQKTRFGIKSSIGKSGIESDVGREYKLKFTDNGDVFFKKGNQKWKSIDADPVLRKAFDKRMNFISTLVDTPAMVGGAVAAIGAAAAGPAIGLGAAAEVGSMLGAGIRSGASALGGGLTQASPMGEMFAKTVEDPLLVDYFLNFKGKTPALVTAGIEGISQGLGEGIAGFFASSAKTNRAIREGASQISEAASRVPEVGASAGLSPGQRALGVPYASEIIDLELEVAKDPSVRSYLIKRNLDEAAKLDQAVGILRSKAPELPKGKSIKDITYTHGGNIRESFIEREVKQAQNNIAANEQELYFSIPNLKNRQMINPTPILAAMEESVIEQFGEEVLTNGVIDPAKVVRALGKPGSVATEGEKDLLQVYIQLKGMTSRGRGATGLSEPVLSESVKVFPESPRNGEYIGAVQDSLSAPPTQDSFLIPGMQGGLPPRGASDLGDTITMQKVPGSPGFESAGSEKFVYGQSQPSLPGASMAFKMPNELKGFVSFKRSLGSMANQFSDQEISEMFLGEKAKFIKARSFLPQGAPGVERDAFITLPQLTDIITKAQRVGDFSSLISSKTSAQRVAAEMSGILNRLRADITMDVASKEGRPDIAKRVLDSKNAYTKSYADLMKVNSAFDTDFLSKSYLNLPTEDAKLLLSVMPEANKLELQAAVVEDLFRKSHFNKVMYTTGQDGEFIGFDRARFFKNVVNNPKTQKNMTELFGKKAYDEILTLGKIAEKVDVYGEGLEQKTKELMKQQIERRGYIIATAIAEKGRNASSVVRVLDALLSVVVPRNSTQMTAVKDEAITNIARKLYQAEMSGGARVTPKSVGASMDRGATEAASREKTMNYLERGSRLGIPNALRGYRVLKSKED